MTTPPVVPGELEAPFVLRSEVEGPQLNQAVPHAPQSSFESLRMNGVLAACLMVLSTCVLPTLTDLEKERTRACDADHACLEGYRCVAQLCVTGSATDAGQCTSGDTRSCGSTVGTCRAGTQTCNTSGTFDSCVAAIGPATEVCDGQDNDCDGTIDNKIASTGLCEKTIGVCAGKSRACVTGHVETTCTAASYGADFELAETLCDGKDNDCDGQVDEALPALPCALNAGVCLGASRVCSGGSYPVCSQAVYQAHSAFYEPVEQSCDGKDNDCDGLVDEFAVRLVSDGGAATYRRLALVRQPPGSGNLLELYESDNRIVARLENADGGVTGPRFPSTSVATAVTRAAFPALAANGSLVYESWFEELNGPIYRLVVANAGPTGEALEPFSGRRVPPEDVRGAVAVEVLSNDWRRAEPLALRLERHRGHRLRDLDWPAPGPALGARERVDHHRQQRHLRRRRRP